jgi:hypothetical protein
MPPSPHVGQNLFFLQHSNNVYCAQVTRNKQPRQSRVKSLREPGGGLGLCTPVAARSREGGVAREGRFGGAELRALASRKGLKRVRGQMLAAGLVQL